MKCGRFVFCLAVILFALATSSESLAQQSAYTAPSTNVGSTSAVQTATLLITQSGTLSKIGVLTQGAANLDFQSASGGTCSVGTAYAVEQSCTINFTFSPLRPGNRLGAIQLQDSSNNVLAMAYISGVGIGPQVTFANSTLGIYAASSQTTLAAELYSPTALAVDGSGNIFVIEDDNLIKEIVAVDGRIPSSPTIKSFPAFGAPVSLAIDGAGNVFVGDAYSPHIGELTAASGYTTWIFIPFSFTGASVALDGSGNVFATDWNSHTVYEILAAGGYNTVKTLASSSEFIDPFSLAVDGDGNVYVAEAKYDYGGGAVKEILAAGGYTTVKTLVRGLSCNGSIALDASVNLYVLDSCQGLVKEVPVAGGYRTVQTLSDGFTSNGLTVDQDGNVIATTEDGQLVKLDYADPPSVVLAGVLPGEKSRDSPQSVTVSNIGNADLIFPVPVSGTNPAMTTGPFTLDAATTCPQVTTSSSAGSLPRGTDCNYAIDFIPTDLETKSGSLVLTDNNLNATVPPENAQTIPLSGTFPPYGWVDRASDATTGSTTVGQSDNLLVAGWAFDVPEGAPVKSVKILIDGYQVGTATLGVTRPDIAAAYSNPAYLTSGWSFTYPGWDLGFGTHHVAAVASDAAGLSATLRTVAFTVDATSGPAPPFGWIDQAVDATTKSTTVNQAHNLLVSGWAADPQDGSPVSSVKILIDGNEAGSATLGGARPDVSGAFKNHAYLNSGWSFTYAASGLSAGTHRVTAVAYDSLGASAILRQTTFTIE
jgi:Bacterial Ig domain